MNTAKAEKIKYLAEKLLEAEERKKALNQEIRDLKTELERANLELEDVADSPSGFNDTLFFLFNGKMHILEFCSESGNFSRLFDTQGEFI